MFKSGLKFLSFVAAGLVVIIAVGLYWLVTSLIDSYLALLIFLPAMLLATYALFYFVISRVIIQRIKPIYKIIKKSKVKHTEESTQRASDDILEEVQSEVSNWVSDTEKEMETLKKLESYRRDYIGNVSHELKTPVFNIQGFIHTLLEGAMYEKKFLKNYLKRASANVERLITILEDLDGITKIESGVMALDITTFDIQELVLKVFDELDQVAAQKEIQLVLKEPSRMGFEVRADRNSIHQVLTNLLINSIKYSDRGGKTMVGFYNIDNDLLVEITDQGLGIAPEHLNHLFDRFYRVDKSRSRAEGGSGLGLSIVKHIIEAHGQTINVRSTPGVGSTFGFTLARR